jgi:predicted nucleic acid-binding protein
MEICSVERPVLEVALTSGLRDFEDAVQVACAIAQSLDVIVTRDTQDFSNATVPVLSASQLLEQLE